MRPSWQAVMMQSSMNTSTVSLSWAIFLHTSGSSSGTSCMRGHSVVPRTLAASSRLLLGATLILSLLLLMLPRLWYLLCSFSTPLLQPDLSDLRSWSDNVAKRPMLKGVLFPALLLPPPPVPPPPPSEAPGPLEAFATAGWGRELERERERGSGKGSVGGLEVPVLVLGGWWCPSTPPLPPPTEVLLTPPLPELDSEGPKVLVKARDSGRRGYNTSSVRSHRQNWVSCPTEPNRYVTAAEPPPLELWRERRDNVLLVRTRPKCMELFGAPWWRSSSLPLSSIGSSSSREVVKGSNATTLTQDLWPWPLATTRLSANDQTVTRSSSPPVARYFPSGLHDTHSSPPK